MRILVAMVSMGLAASGFAADSFEGHYRTTDGAATLTITPEGPGSLRATLLAADDKVQFLAAEESGRLRGNIDTPTGRLGITGTLKANTLTVRFADIVRDGRSIAGNSYTLVFDRIDAARPSAHGTVTINGRRLSAADQAELTRRYRVAPQPGEYWYDTDSGLYGVVGHQAFGFMMPGHDFGAMPANVSAGTTNVFINGRELPQSEWLIWSYMLGTPILSGRYWLDGLGNAGFVGNPIPTINLYTAARRNAYAGRGGSGDNFWSSRFSAGNHDANNGYGYVSVPGHGPVGYGF